MSLMKKTLLAAAAVSVMFGMVSCSDDAAPTNTTKPVNATTVKAQGGWSDVSDSGTVVYNTAETSDSAFSVVLTRQKADEATDFWPTAAATASVTDKNFEGLTKIIVTYNVRKMPATADGLAFYITKCDADGNVLLGADNYGGFRAVLTAGKEAMNTDVTDTLTLADFYLDWGFAASGYDFTVSGTDTSCTLDQNSSVLDSASGLGFLLENDNTAGADTVDFSVKSIKVVGASL